jgi:beta-lactamase class A
MHRRLFTLAASASLCPLVARSRTQKISGPSPEAAAGQATATAWAQIEAEVGGRLGVAVLDSATGQLTGHRLDERFPLCSTFKWLLAATVLHQVDSGRLALNQRVQVRRADLIPNSPVTTRRVGGSGMSLAELCEATVTTSDNTAANLVLPLLGGRDAVNAFARVLGDTSTRLDRDEPMLNDAQTGDPRDTTTPRGMATSLRAAVLGDTLSAASRSRLQAWMLGAITGPRRLRAGLPPGWRIGHKTGTGDHGSTNDVGALWPPKRAPLVITAFLTDTTAPRERCEAALAAVAREAVQRA